MKILLETLDFICIFFLSYWWDTFCQVEEALKEIHFSKTSIFRPGLLERGDKKRFVEKVYGKLKTAKGMWSIYDVQQNKT